MTIFLLKYKNSEKTLNIVELFGLSRSGKSSLLENFKKKGKKCLFSSDISFKNKLSNIIKFIIKYPVLSLYLLFKTNINWIVLQNLTIKDYLRIFIMRNSYLGAVLAKYEILSKEKVEVYLDEFIMQSIFMIIQKKSSESELDNLFRILPKSRKIIIVESSEKERYERIKKTRFPAQQINKEYAIAWMKNMEYNYKIIKKILKKYYVILKPNQI